MKIRRAVNSKATILRFCCYLLLPILLLCTGCSPSGNVPPGNAGFQSNSINLFPDEDTSVDNKDSLLDFADAEKQSAIVVCTSSLTIIDSSKDRGVKPFFLYHASVAKIIKPHFKLKNRKSSFITFLSGERLQQPQNPKDTVYLFLTPLQQYRLLRKNMNIRYKWLDKAPRSVSYN